MGEPKLCALCGKALPEKVMGNRKYCDECKDAVAKGRMYDHRSLKMERRREEQNKPKAPKVGEGKTLTQMAVEARELGLTYGQYSSLLASGGLAAYKKNHKPKQITKAHVRPGKMWG